jgi:predicted acylesterase/phospholipase RssA
VTGFRGLSGGQIALPCQEKSIEQESRVGQRIPVTLGNIAPLAVKPFRPGKLALVCEGGGQRGIFTAGVLDEFMRADLTL